MIARVIFLAKLKSAIWWCRGSGGLHIGSTLKIVDILALMKTGMDLVILGQGRYCIIFMCSLFPYYVSDILIWRRLSAFRWMGVHIGYNRFKILEKSNI